MKIREDHEYAYNLEAVYAMFTVVEEVEAKHAALGARAFRIEEREVYDDGADVRFVRELPADVRGILAKFLRPWNTVLQSEQWRSSNNGGYDAELDIEIENVPVTITGILELEPTDRGCVNHVRVDVDCGIPFVGGTLAEYVAKDCERLIADEYQYICERLSSA